MCHFGGQLIDTAGVSPRGEMMVMLLGRPEPQQEAAEGKQL
jgi:hypothetical protein